MAVSFLIVLSFGTLALCQRPFFAGIRPIGYPEVTTEALADRFGEVDGTTQRLPIEANGDRDLVDRLSKLPIDKQPFWLINWQALEAHRQKPQTYPQKPNTFVDPIQNNFPASNTQNSGNVNPNSGNVNPNSANANPNSGNFNLNAGNTNPSSGSVASSDNGFFSSNRFGVEEHPNNQDPIENAYTNSHSENHNVNFPNKSTEQKKNPIKDKNVQHSYRN